MLFFIGWILTLLIVVGACLFGTYMDYCYKDNIKMFANPKYHERIKKLEKEVEYLRKELERKDLEF